MKKITLLFTALMIAVISHAQIHPKDIQSGSGSEGIEVHYTIGSLDYDRIADMNRNRPNTKALLKLGDGLNYLLSYDYDGTKIDERTKEKMNKAHKVKQELRIRVWEVTPAGRKPFLGKRKMFNAGQKQFQPWPGNVFVEKGSGLIYNKLMLFGLKPNTKYEFEVHFNIDVKTFFLESWTRIFKARSGSKYFTTPNMPAPTGLIGEYIKSNRAQVKWNKVFGANAYALAYTSNGGKTWKSVMTNRGDRPIHNSAVTPNTRYHVVVAAHHNNGAWSNWGNMLTFKTPGSSSLTAEITPTGGGVDASVKVSELPILGDLESLPESDSMMLPYTDEESIVYPNTNSGDFTILFKGSGGEKTITIYDMVGREVYKKQLGKAVEEETFNLNGKLTSGMYKIKISSNDGVEYKTIVVE